MSTLINFADLASELLSGILDNCADLATLLALASTCKRLRHLFQLRKLTYLAHVVDTQYGPLDDAIQLVTQNLSQPAHVSRSVPWSMPLFRQVVRAGRTASRWQDIYPSKHWHVHFENRRLLLPAECRKLRRALYRLWLYNKAFHCSAQSRYGRMAPQNLLGRAALLHNWSNADLAEIADVQEMLRQVVKSNVCPSNGTIERKFRTRFPDSSYQLLFNNQFNYPFPPTSRGNQCVNMDTNRQYKHYQKYNPTSMHEPGCEGWGDESDHYFVVEDMLKLNPEQILWLKENAPSKSQVEAYRKGLGDWFFNNGTTFGQTLDFVLNERGVELEGFWGALEDDKIGIAGAGAS